MRTGGLLAILALLTAALLPSQAVAASPNESVWVKVAFIAAGAAVNEVGYDLHVNGDSAHGPQSLARDADGTLFVLDSVKRRILEARGGTVRVAADLIGLTYPRELAVTTTRFFVLDDSNRVLEVDRGGALVRATALPVGMPANLVLGLRASTTGRPVLWATGYQEFDVDNLPTTVDLEAPILAKDRSARGVQAPSGVRWLGELSGPISGSLFVGAREIAVATSGQFGAAHIVGFDQTAQAYALVEDLYTTGSNQLGVELSLRRYNTGGLLTGATRVPFEPGLYVPRRSVDVGADGTAYVMVPTLDGVSIYAVRLGTGYRTQIRPSAPAKAGRPTSATVSPAWATSLTRSQVISRADQMATLTWTWHLTYDKFSDGSSRPPNTQPIQFAGASDGGTMYGIPYNYGGFDTPWSVSDWTKWVSPQLWTSWAGALTKYYPANGPLVGNYSGNVYSSPASAGVDCSGYVYAALGDTANPKKGSIQLSIDGLDAGAVPSGQPGDYYANNVHVFMYQYRTLDATGINTLESTVAGNPQAAKRYFRTFSDAASYAHRSWWTYASGESPALAYTSGRSVTTSLRGTTTWFYFTTSGTTVRLSGMSGGDADLYVYNASLAYVGRSTNGGTSDDSVVVGAGTYYAAAHQWSTASVSWTMSW